MSALIPALINLLMSGRGGRGGGGGGGRPEPSQQEKSDYYWTGRLMSGDLDPKQEKGGKPQPPLRIKSWADHMGGSQGR